MPYLGEILALSAPLCWSVALLLYRRTTAELDPGAITLFKNGFALVLLTLTLPLIGEAPPVDRPLGDWARVLASGVIGLLIADLFIFAALSRLGASRFAVVDTLYAPLLVLLSVLFLGEQLSPSFLVWGTLVVLGVGIANVERKEEGPPPDRTKLLTGIAFGALGVSGTAIGVILTKPVLEHASVVEVTWTRLLGGFAAQVLYLLARGEAHLLRDAVRPIPAWRTLVPAAFIGTYLSLILWIGGFKWADASVAAVLNQMATVYILVLAWWILGERIPAHRALGGLMAAGGALGVVLGG